MSSSELEGHLAQRSGVGKWNHGLSPFPVRGLPFICHQCRLYEVWLISNVRFGVVVKWTRNRASSLKSSHVYSQHKVLWDFRYSGHGGRFRRSLSEFFFLGYISLIFWFRVWEHGNELGLFLFLFLVPTGFHILTEEAAKVYDRVVAVESSFVLLEVSGNNLVRKSKFKESTMWSAAPRMMPFDFHIFSFYTFSLKGLLRYARCTYMV